MILYVAFGSLLFGELFVALFRHLLVDDGLGELLVADRVHVPRRQALLLLEFLFLLLVLFLLLLDIGLLCLELFQLLALGRVIFRLELGLAQLVSNRLLRILGSSLFIDLAI